MKSDRVKYAVKLPFHLLLKKKKRLYNNMSNLK